MRLLGATNTRKSRAVRVARTGADAVKWLRRGMAVTGADDFGAINAYNDRDGKYRCEAMRWQQTVDSQIFTSLAQVRKWWVAWRKNISERALAEGE